ncbi:RNA polymerase II-associated factor 1 homolog [Folsomia candida]|uniref:RNA polymerase II-associated factor 1 homolog n=1 Tax=Folsomia candida TaxID=158441 RepID=A0A226EHJ2_FOLCA|nr:RNA polymerase II-associated factor 1 homolog [Folsomia candida]OXA56800.1 RNA polymerase II-associated factor 1 [Folsomia candida]
MPPTIQNSIEKRPSRSIGGSGSTERRSELVTRVKYGNTLPDLPFDPKFISYPFSSNRFVEYSTTSLEKNFKYDVLSEIDLGVDVELVIPSFYDPPKNANLTLDHKDEKLLEDDNLFHKDKKRSRHHAKSVSWLRRTEYISTEQTRFQPQTIDKVEAKVGYSIKKSLKDDVHYMDRDSQIKNIEKTFEDAVQPIDLHFAKPGVEPIEILPVFPDFSLWKYPCAQVIFDSDPAPVTMQDRPLASQIEEMSQAMIRGVMDESGEQFVAYFLPTEDTLQKRKKDQETGVEYEDEEVYEYRMAREYNWNVKTKATKGYEETYFFVMRDNGIFYNELETRVRLNKRRTRGPNQQLNTRLCVKHVPLTASDYKFQRNRERQLEPMQEEEEEEEKSDDEKSVKSDDDMDGGGEKKIDPKKEEDKKASKPKDDNGGSDISSESDSDAGSRRSRSRSPSPAKKTKNVGSDDDKASRSSRSGSEKGSPKRRSSRSDSGSGSSSRSSSDSD